MMLPVVLDLLWEPERQNEQLILMTTRFYKVPLLRAPYPMSGACIGLSCYAESSTEIGYAATRRASVASISTASAQVASLFREISAIYRRREISAINGRLPALSAKSVPFLALVPPFSGKAVPFPAAFLTGILAAQLSRRAAAVR
eukprot:718927-Rhodomonas_salina.3